MNEYARAVQTSKKYNVLKMFCGKNSKFIYTFYGVVLVAKSKSNLRHKYNLMYRFRHPSQ